jgi:hypothetical protein
VSLYETILLFGSAGFVVLASCNLVGWLSRRRSRGDFFRTIVADWRRIVGIGYGCALLPALLYVPWQIQAPSGVRVARGYGLLWLPPERCVVDESRLMLQLIALTVVFAVLYLLSPRSALPTGEAKPRL